MCANLNFTKINQKRKKLLTSILARFSSLKNELLQLRCKIVKNKKVA